MNDPSTPAGVLRYRDGRVDHVTDALVTEEPLELRILDAGEELPVALTMRTPGHDPELALGYLYAEGAIRAADDVLRTETWREGETGNPNVLRLELRAGLTVTRGLARHTFTSSACGICGTGSIEQLAVRARPAVWTAPPLEARLLTGLPATLRAHQALFESTGGLHAAALFTPQGELLAIREDIGRHNATDKLIGWALGQAMLPLSDHLLVVSGRAGFEIAQKAALAGIPVVCSVSAPSSLAVQIAESFDVTLVGFMRENRFNVYSSPGRVELDQPALTPSARSG